MLVLNTTDYQAHCHKDVVCIYWEDDMLKITIPFTAILYLHHLVKANPLNQYLLQTHQLKVYPALCQTLLGLLNLKVILSLSVLFTNFYRLILKYRVPIISFKKVHITSMGILNICNLWILLRKIVIYLVGRKCHLHALFCC